MNNKSEQGKINLPKNQKQWKLYQQIEQFCQELDTPTDAAKVKEQRPQSAPINLLPMVF